MCGIFASTRPDRAAAERALDAMARRGPDGRGVRQLRDATLGHVRLAIIDLDRGSQPMTNEDESLTLVFNGEVYGHAALREELIAKGHRFRSRSDAEVVLHLYEELGQKALAHLRGEFAFVIHDARTKTIFAARDRFGIKPLVWAKHEGDVLLASQAKALFAAGVPASWNDQAFFQAVSMQYPLPTTTLFDGVNVLPPGNFLMAQDGNVHIERYWDLDYPTTPSTLSFDEAAEQLRALLTDAVQTRLVADVPVAFQLSGGIDSSSVLALANRADAEAFTIAFEDPRYDERAIATAMAERVGAKLHVIETNAALLAAELPAAIGDGEGIAINAHIAAKRILARSVRDAGFKVVLTGEGADEVLAGYAHLRADLGDEVLAANPVSAGLMLPDGDALDTSAVKAAMGFVPTWLMAKACLGHRVHSLLSREWRGDAFATLMANTDREQLRGGGRVEQSLYLWTKLALEGYILRTLGDGMEMSASIEGRLPFLDHRLFEFVRTLPTHFKITSETTKHILRAAMGDRLTPELRTRPKHPFLAPLVAQHIAPTLRDELAPQFDRAKVTSLLDRLPAMSLAERTAIEPALMLVYSASVLDRELVCRAI